MHSENKWEKEMCVYLYLIVSSMSVWVFLMFKLHYKPPMVTNAVSQCAFSFSLICLNHNETQHELDLFMCVCTCVCLCVPVCACVCTCLTHQRGGSQLTNVIAAGFIRNTAVGGILAILHSMMNKKRGNI